jgi:hypothetical protein
MKYIKPFLVIALITCLATLKAQPYKSIFGDSTTVWHWQVGNICDVFCSDSIYVEKDTVINNLDYKKIIYCTFSPYCTMGYLREDTTIGKVWFLPRNFSSEHIALDFSKNLGDTIKRPDGFGALTVTNVYYQDNRKHIVYNFNGQNGCFAIDSLIIIEGIGSNAGVFPNDFFYDYIYKVPKGFLFGVIKDDSLEYINPQGFPLDYCSVGIKENEALDKLFTIYPNPVIDVFSINIKTQVKTPVVKIYNITGNLVYSKTLSGNGVQQLTAYGLVQGVYIINLYNQNELIATRKLIIAN